MIIDYGIDRLGRYHRGHRYHSSSTHKEIYNRILTPKSTPFSLRRRRARPCRGGRTRTNTALSRNAGHRRRCTRSVEPPRRRSRGKRICADLIRLDECHDDLPRAQRERSVTQDPQKTSDLAAMGCNANQLVLVAFK